MGVAGWVEGGAEGMGFSRRGELGVCPRSQAPARLQGSEEEGGGRRGEVGRPLTPGRTQPLRSQLAPNPSDALCARGA